MSDALDGAAQQFLPCIAEDVAEFLVHAEQTPIQREVGDANCGLLKGGAKPLFAAVLRLLGTFAVRDIVRHPEPHLASSHGDPVRDDLHLENSPVLFAVAPDAGIPVGQSCQKLQQPGDILRREQVLDGHREKFLPRIAILADHGLIHGLVAQRFKIVHPHRHGAVIEKPPVALLALAQGLGGPFLLLPQLSPLQRGSDYLAQAPHAVFHHVIAGSLPDDRDGEFLPYRARDNDEGNIQPLLTKQFQGVQGIDLRQAEIAQDHIQLLIESGYEILLGVHAFPLRVEPRGAQFRQHQFGVARVVFKNQYAQGGGHRGLRAAIFAPRKGGSSGHLQPRKHQRRTGSHPANMASWTKSGHIPPGDT